MTLTKIIELLKKHGPYKDETEIYVPFAAEWQDWSFQRPGKAILMLGYWYEQNGDMVPDPSYVFTLLHGEIERVTMTTSLGTTHDVTNDPMTTEFVELVWQRHLCKLET